MSEQLFAAAEQWRDDDPDPITRNDLDLLLTLARVGNEEALRELRDAFAGFLEFGTAGLRGAIGAGPNRMNRAVVIRAASGFSSWLKSRCANPAIVIGFDARHRSDDFARDTAAVATAAGLTAMILPSALPTPVLAFALRHLGATGGVMVTASHNPPQDNGYKVYLGADAGDGYEGSQIVPPVDSEIAAHIARLTSTANVPMTDDGWTTLDDSIVEEYLNRTAALIPRNTYDLRIVHTPLHGVGGQVVLDVLARCGFHDVHVVSEQFRPDPEFPTVAFPNPEEAGAIDAALALAQQVNADLVLANDPDADRCAAAAQQRDGSWRMLRGDEVGALLGWWVLERARRSGSPLPHTAVFANSIVSSQLLGKIAAAAGVRFAETLTGFKWLARLENLAFAYEEALGYCVDPATVRDKDGVSAALLVAELADTLKSEGRTLWEVLDDLAMKHGLHLTDQLSIRVKDLSVIAEAMQRLRTAPPTSLGGRSIDSIDDLSLGGALPPTDGLRFWLDGVRIIARPSGTEPKLKVYLEAIEPVTSSVEDARIKATATLQAVKADLATFLA